MRSVDIGLSENGVGHIYSRGVPPRPTPRRWTLVPPIEDGPSAKQARMPRASMGITDESAHSHLSPVTLTPGGGGASSGTKKVGASGSPASTRYFSKSVTPAAARKVSSIRKLPVKLRDGLWNTRYAASAMICGVRDIRITRSPPSRFLMAAVAMVVRG